MSGVRRRPLEGLGILFALALALVATVLVLVAPWHRWGPGMWPFYVGTMGILLWVAIDLWPKLRDRPADAGEAPADAEEAPADAQDTDMLVRDAEGAVQGSEDFGDKRELPDRRN
jgi:hypothetical protein